jgi:hypothetical protein
MKITELIGMLQAMQEVHGDLDVETLSRGYGERQAVRPPRLACRAILTGRERKERFWIPQVDHETKKGEPVCRLD